MTLVRALVVCGAVFSSNYVGSVLGVVQQQIGLGSFAPGIGGAVLAGIPWFLAGMTAGILVAMASGPRSVSVDQFLLMLVIAAEHLLGSGALQAGPVGLNVFVVTIGLMHVLGALVVACLIWWRRGRVIDGVAA